MEEKVFALIEEYGMFQAGDYVIVGLSGGADSVALFHFLLANRDRLGISLSAAHFEHGLRGEESLRDAKFVQRVCADSGVRLYMESGQMDRRERPTRMGTEAWARQLRYAFFEALARQHGAVVATAHTLSDNAETVLFNLIRGAGTRGLAGIRAKRGAIVRPLLEVSRAEVEDYCARHGLDYMTDSTNADPQYSRNLIRGKVMPLLEQAHPGAGRAMARAAKDLRQLDDWLEAEAMQLLARAAGRGTVLAQDLPSLAGETGFQAPVLVGAAQPLRAKALALLAGRHASSAAVAQLEQVLEGKLKGWPLPGGRTARVVDERLFFLKEDAVTIYIDYERPLAEGDYHLPGGFALRVEMPDGRKREGLSKNSDKKGLTFVADCDKISKCSVFRTRRSGDRFAQARRGVTKPLKKWMNEEKMPLSLRGSLPLLADGPEVLWVWGTGFCERVLPDEDTQRLLVIHTAHG